MDILCVGMYRSGSTWQYDVASDLITSKSGGRRLGVVSGEQYASLPPAAGDAWRCLKFHEGHPAFAAALRDGRARAVYSFRDLRDVAYSLVHKFESTFSDLIVRGRALHDCLTQDAFWRAQPGVLLQRYDDLICAPAACVARLAGHLGLTLAEGEAETLAHRYSLGANRKRATELEAQLRRQGVDLSSPSNALIHDKQTLLHWNHIRDGRSGSWKDQVTPRELIWLALTCTDWLIEHHYEQSPDWWQAHFHALSLTVEEAQVGYADAMGELSRSSRELKQAEARLSQAEQELASLRGELDRTRKQAAVEEAAVGHTQFGPVTLRLARQLRNLSLRYPRVSTAFKRLLSF